MAKIGVIAGDGVGPEVVREGLAVLEDGRRPRRPVARPRGVRPRRRALTSRPAKFCPTRRSTTSAGATPSTSGRSAIPASRPGSWKRASCSASGSPSISTSTSVRSSSSPGVETPIKGKGPEQIDLVVVRENNEDLYVGAGGFTYKGTPEEVAIQTSINTRAGVERCLRYAFKLARSRATARPFPGLTEGRPLGRLRRPGDDGGQDQRPDLRPRPLDAGLHRSRPLDYPEIKPTTTTSTPAACGWWSPRAVRRDRDDQHVRRHHHRPGRGPPRGDGPGGFGEPQPRPDRSPACSSRSTAPRPTSPARDRQPDRGRPLAGDDARPRRRSPKGPGRPPGGGPGPCRRTPRTPDLGGTATTAEVGRAVP